MILLGRMPLSSAAIPAGRAAPGAGRPDRGGGRREESSESSDQEHLPHNTSSASPRHVHHDRCHQRGLSMTGAKAKPSVSSLMESHR